MLQTAIADAGIARQAAKGAPAANPKYQFGLKGGQVAQVDVSQDVEDLTSGKRVAGHANRTSAIPGADWTTRAWIDQIGLVLLAGLGDYSVTGAGPFTHEIRVGNALDYWTVWGSQDGAHYRLDDAKLDELSISWDRNEPVEVACTWIGRDLTPGVADPVPDADVTCQTYLDPVGGTFQLDVDGQVPVDAKVVSGEITIANGLSADPVSGAITPDDVDESRVDLSASLTVKVDDVAAWREAHFGAAGGTDISQVVVYGSFEISFVRGAHSLTVAASRVPFLCELPAVDPAGGPAEIALEGEMLGCNAEAIEVTVVNDVADYTA